MKRLGKTYRPHVYDGAGHGFLRDQNGRDGANRRATEQAWPATVAFSEGEAEVSGRSPACHPRSAG
jgi:dienelactone hydrolase